MQICRSIAGYSYARADLVRRAMAKKKTDVMEKERQAFLYGQQDENGNVVNTGAIAAGMTEEAAGKLFDEMASFAKYAFNKSHASAYAFTSYRTAYLKRHYPGEYFSALLTSVNGSLNKTAEYIAEAQRMHISILAPDINESAKYFHVAEKDGRQCIRFGLLAVKNVGVQFVEHIIKEREKRPFADFEDFVARMAEAQDCPKRPIEAFIKCGAFDSIAKKRSQLYASYETIIDQYTDRMRTAVTGQLDLFSAFSEESADAAGNRPVRGGGYRYPDIPEFSGREKLLLERDATGQCFSGHLLDDYMQHLEQLNPTEIGDILAAFETEGDNEDGTPGIGQPNLGTSNAGIPMGDHAAGGNGSSGLFSDKQQVAIAGVVSKRVSKLTKKGDTMAFVTVEDRYAEMEVIVFPKVLESAAPYLAYDTAIFVVGELSVREEEAPKLLARTIFPLRTNDAMRDDAVLPPLPEKPESGDAPPLRSPASAARNRTDPTENGSGRGHGYGARNAVSAKPASPTPIPADAKTLFLRVPRAAEDDDRFRHAKNLAEIFVYDERSREMQGIRAAVVFYDEAEKQYHKQLTAPIALTPYVLLQFEELLGRENAILR